MIEDLSRVNSLSRVVLEIRNMVGRNIPIRFGMVALVNEDEDACKVFYRSLYLY
jgi:UDP-glucose:glycoprotein glucosyltransferase